MLYPPYKQPVTKNGSIVSFSHKYAPMGGPIAYPILLIVYRMEKTRILRSTAVRSAANALDTGAKKEVLTPCNSIIKIKKYTCFDNMNPKKMKEETYKAPNITFLRPIKSDTNPAIKPLNVAASDPTPTIKATLTGSKCCSFTKYRGKYKMLILFPIAKIIVPKSNVFTIG